MAHHSPFEGFNNPTTAEGRKLWELATRALKSEFNGGQPDYPLFKSQIRNRVNECLWTDLISFAVGNQTHNLVDNADLIPLSDVARARRAQEHVLLVGARAAADGVPAISAQDVAAAELAHFQSSMLHTVLVKSVTGTLEKHVAELQNQGKTHGDGPTLLKLIQDKARGKAVRQQMSNVREEIRKLSLKEFKWSITDFNERLNSLITTLRDNEEEFLDKDIADLVTKNYKSVKHEEFRTVIVTEINAADKLDQDVDWEELMELAEAKFQAMVRAGVWGK